MTPFNYYKLGGSLEYQHPTYVVRQADSQLYEALKNGDFCYVLNSRQMGKSSLRVHIMKQLKEQGIKCASVDLTRIGSHVTPSEWYGGFVSELLRGFGLSKKVNFGTWWREREFLPPKQRLSQLIDNVLLTEFLGKIIIFIDEIDSILNISFKDDFFAFIRACYNQRADNLEYQRLTFCLLGVATPSDLIADKNRTPFNIGRAIALTGFKLDEVEVLGQGLSGIVARPRKILEEVLYWTGGQPFLTQKLCQLICISPDSFPEGREREYVEILVQTQIIQNWEAQDEPEHLRTIRDRLTRISENQAGRLLGLYQQILQVGEIPATDSPEQTQLRLTGLVVKQTDKLQVYNRIYAEIFNLAWVDRALANIRPYNQAFKAWVNSDFTDESRLLRGQSLQDARNWSADKGLSDLDRRFLDASQELEKRDIQRKLQIEAEATQILSQANDVLSVANHKAKRRIQIGGGVLGFVIIIAIFVGIWANKMLQEIQLEKTKSLSISANALLNSDRELEALLVALRAAKQLKSLIHVDINTQESVRLTLQRAIFKIKEKNILEGHNDAVRSVVFSPDGQTIATASEDNTVRLWNISGKEIKKFTLKNQIFRNVIFSSDSKKIAAIDSQNNATVWDIKGQKIASFAGQNEEQFMSSICFSPDGKVIVAPSQKNTVTLWHIDGRKIKTIDGHKNPVWAISCSPDGTRIVTADRSGTLIIWSADGQQIKTFQASEKSIFGVSFSPDSKTIATAAGDTTVKLWNLDGKEIIAKEPRKHDNYAISVSFSPDGEAIASTSADNTIKLWSIDGRQLKTLKGHKFSVFSASFSPDNKTIASASGDNTVKLWDIHNIEPKTLIEHRDSLWSVSASPDGKIIASAGDDNTVKLWNIDGQLIKSIDTNINNQWNRIWSLKFSLDGQTIATANTDKTIRIWNLNGENIKTFTAHKDQVVDISYSPDNQTLVSASFDGTIKLWNQDGRELKTFAGNVGKVRSVNFSPNSKIIASGHNNGTIQLWNLQGQNLKIIEGHISYITDAKFSPDGKIIASASQDKTIKLWNLDGQLLKTLPSSSETTQMKRRAKNGHVAQVTKISFSPDGKIIASASADGTIRLWQVTDGKEIRIIEGEGYPIWNLIFSRDGQKIISVDDRGFVELWQAEIPDLERLRIRGCSWLADYLQNSSYLHESERNICK